MFLNHFDAFISKIIFKNKKDIILIHLWVKSTFKNSHNHALFINIITITSENVYVLSIIINYIVNEISSSQSHK